MSVSGEPSGENSIEHAPIRAANDPLVSCPIVCGEYMRATGFFFRADSQTYLITSRHNFSPTTVSITNPQTGGMLVDYSSTGHHQNIDVFLRSGENWVYEQIETTEALDMRLNEQFNLDVVALKIEFEPEQYGYRIWTPTSLSEPEEEEHELMVIGFDSASFPSAGRPYSVERYCQSLGKPRFIPFENSLKSLQSINLPRIGIGLELQAAGSYDGLSGSPVIGNGLVGIHTYDDSLPQEALMQLGEPHAHRLGYFRSDILHRLSTPLR